MSEYAKPLSCKESRKFIVDLIEALIDLKAERDFTTHMCRVHDDKPSCTALKEIEGTWKPRINDIFVDLQFGLDQFKKCKVG